VRRCSLRLDLLPPSAASGVPLLVLAPPLLLLLLGLRFLLMLPSPQPICSLAS
jgi:hypothetical protein